MPTNNSRRARLSRKRARRVAAADNDLTGAQWSALVAQWERCAYCGGDGPFQKDCVLPISRGGRYTVENVVPACRSCNASKCNSEVTGWMRRKKLDERAFLQRHAEILHAGRAAAVPPVAGVGVPPGADLGEAPGAGVVEAADAGEAAPSARGTGPGRPTRTR